MATIRLEVTANDVAQDFLDLALARCATGSFATVDDGNVAAAPRESRLQPAQFAKATARPRSVRWCFRFLNAPMGFRRSDGF